MTVQPTHSVGAYDAKTHFSELLAKVVTGVKFVDGEEQIQETA